MHFHPHVENFDPQKTAYVYIICILTFMDNFILQLLTNTDSTYTITFINMITIFCTYLNKAGMGHDMS